MKTIIRAAALAVLTVWAQPVTAGVDVRETYVVTTISEALGNHWRIGISPISPYETGPYVQFRDAGFELRPETEVDPYQPVSAWLDRQVFSRDPEFWTPRPLDDLMPQDWGSGFWVTRGLEEREFSRQKPRLREVEPPHRFNEPRSRNAIRAGIKALAEAEADQREKALWDQALKRVTRALKKAGVDGPARKKVLRSLKKAHAETIKQKAALRAEIERLDGEAGE